MTVCAPSAIRLTGVPTGVGARMRGVGSAQPPLRMTGDELGARVGRTADWIEARTGIRELRVLGAGGTLAELATDAARAAITDGAVDPSTIDLVIAATCSQRTGSDSLSQHLASTLAPMAATFDLNAACAGFAYSLAAADALVRDGAATTVLVVAAEHMTGIVDPDDLGTSIIFGDGAGAAVLTAAPDDGVYIGPPAWGSDGAAADLIAIPTGELYLTMGGRQVFRWAVEQMPDLARQACKLAGVSLEDIDVFVPHQANARIVDAVTTALGLDEAVVSRDVTVSGNTSAASIPIALANLREGGQHRGELALLMGFGAGLTYAAQVVRLP